MGSLHLWQRDGEEADIPKNEAQRLHSFLNETLRFTALNRCIPPGAFSQPPVAPQAEGRRRLDKRTATRAGAAAPPDSASLRQRSSVATLTPISRDTTSTDALSGGSNRATAMSLNSCPYLAIQLFHQRPQFEGSVGRQLFCRGGATAAHVQDQLRPARLPYATSHELGSSA